MGNPPQKKLIKKIKRVIKRPSSRPAPAKRRLVKKIVKRPVVRKKAPSPQPRKAPPRPVRKAPPSEQVRKVPPRPVRKAPISESVRKVPPRPVRKVPPKPVRKERLVKKAPPHHVPKAQTSVTPPQQQVDNKDYYQEEHYQPQEEYQTEQEDYYQEEPVLEEAYAQPTQQDYYQEDYEDLDEQQVFETNYQDSQGDDVFDISQDFQDDEAEAEIEEEESFDFEEQDFSSDDDIRPSQTLVFPEPADDPKFIQKLRKEERSLYKAYRGFLRAGFQGALRGGFDPVIPRVEAKYMGPVVKDEVVKALQEDMINVWSILSAIFPYELGGVTGNESDNQLLSIAENAEDPILQEAIFSHIEVLIELEAIEIRQEALGLKKEKKKIVKQYNEMKYMREKVINTYVEKLEKHKFPIDARKLMTNYLKAASKAPQKAFQTLTSNPAMFAPIEIDKMPKKLFGLIKPSPKDARNMNKKIARFLKKAKP